MVAQVLFCRKREFFKVFYILDVTGFNSLFLQLHFVKRNCVIDPFYQFLQSFALSLS